LELDVRLLDRSPHHVALTEAGRIFLADASRIVRQADAASSGIRAWQEGTSHRLRIGYLADAVPRALPAALQHLAGSATPTSVELSTSGPHDLIAQVRDEGLDAAIVSLPAPVTGLRVVPFAHEHAAVAVRAGMFDGREDEVPIELVGRNVLLTHPRHVNPGFHDAVVAAFRAAGVPARLVEVDGASVEQLSLHVAAGAGMAIVPGSAVGRIRVPGIAFRHLAPRSAVRCQLVAVAAHRTPSEPLTTFLSALTSRSGAPEGAPGALGEAYAAAA